MSTAIFTGAPGGADAYDSSAGMVARRERRWGFAFVSPWLVGFLVFFTIPLVASLVISFTDYELADQDDTPTSFVGLENWRRLFDDPDVTQGALVTLKYACVAIPLALLLPLGLAYLMTSKHLRFKGFFRALFYLPTMVPFVAAAIVWRFYLNGEFGWFSKLFAQVGIDVPDFGISATMAMTSLFLMGTWGIGNAMIIDIAALNGVPRDLYEAATLDGAGPLRVFRDVTFPMISPIVFYNLVLSLVGLGQYFVVPYVLTDGSGKPDGALSFYTMYFYKQTFVLFQGGYGAALAWAMFIVIFSLTALLFWSARFWVHYEYEER
jgi:ABC-type sugar transport system permease subunit